MCKTRKIEHEKPDEKPDPFEVMWSGVVPSTNSSFESVVFQQIANQSIKEVEQDSQRLDCNNGKNTDTFKNRGLADQKRSADFPMRRRSYQVSQNSCWYWSAVALTLSKK